MAVQLRNCLIQKGFTAGRYSTNTAVDGLESLQLRSAFDRLTDFVTLSCYGWETLLSV